MTPDDDVIPRSNRPNPGFQDFNLVLLTDAAPGDAMQRLLKTHPQAHRLMYVQGCPLNDEVRLGVRPDKTGSGFRNEGSPCRATPHVLSSGARGGGADTLGVCGARACEAVPRAPGSDPGPLTFHMGCEERLGAAPDALARAVASLYRITTLYQ
jgi:hypothetical protein